MDILKFWRRGADKSHTLETKEPPDNANSNIVENPDISTVTQKTPDHWDPAVVEFFNDFPEPYREKAIERYSRREGLNRYDFFRSIAMSDERRQALKGIFVEDQREFEERSYRQSELQRIEELEKEKVLFAQREIPPWEQQALKVIPLQPGEKMWAKLALAVNLSALGGSFIYKWSDYLRETPKPPQTKLVRTFIGSLGVCCMLQAFAVYRLLDWGVFDRSTDERHFLVKIGEDLKKDLKVIGRYFDEEPSKR